MIWAAACRQSNKPVGWQPEPIDPRPLPLVPAGSFPGHTLLPEQTPAPGEDPAHRQQPSSAYICCNAGFYKYIQPCISGPRLIRYISDMCLCRTLRVLDADILALNYVITAARQCTFAPYSLMCAFYPEHLRMYGAKQAPLPHTCGWVVDRGRLE